MKIVTEKISIKELNEMAKNMFGNLVKAVVDIEKKIMVVGGELHADEESLLLNNGSMQKNLWGINIYPQEKENLIEFDSLINIRPSIGNMSRTVEDETIKKIITKIIQDLILK